MPHDLDQLRPPVARQLATDLVHDDLGIRLPRQVMVPIAQQAVAQLLVVGQLAVEREAEPLVLLQMMPLERLSVAAVVRPAGGVADVTDARATGVLVHQLVALQPMGQAENFGDGADLLVSVDQLIAVGIVGRDARRQLSAILDVQQHAGQQARYLVGTRLRTEWASGHIRQMIDRGDAAFVMEFAHAPDSMRDSALSQGIIL